MLVVPVNNFLLTKATLRRAMALAQRNPDMAANLKAALLEYASQNPRSPALAVRRYIIQYGIKVFFTEVAKYREKQRINTGYRQLHYYRARNVHDEASTRPAIHIHLHIDKNGLAYLNTMEVIRQLPAIAEALGNPSVDVTVEKEDNKTPQFDKEAIRQDILSYVKRLTIYIDRNRHDDYMALWEAILDLPVVEKDVYKKYGTATFNRKLVATIMRLLLEKEVYCNTNPTRMAEVLEGSKDHSVRGNLGIIPDGELKRSVLKLLTKLWNTKK